MDDSRNNGTGTGFRRPPVETQFKAGNPGRPKGSKNKFTEDFWRDIHDAWAEHGRQAILDTLRADPAKFLAVAASMIPKELEVTNREFVVVVPAQAQSVDEWLSDNHLLLEQQPIKQLQ